MQTTRSGCSFFSRLALVLFLVAGLTLTGAQQSTPRKPAGTGNNGGSTSAPESPGKQADGSGTTTRQSSGSDSSVSQPQSGNWLDISSGGERYKSVETRMLELLDVARDAGVPQEVFMIRMKEALAKNVAPAVFIAALEIDTAYWLRIAAMLRDADWPPASKAPDFYIAASNALRNGVSNETISTLIAWALESRGTPERAGAVLMSVSSLTALMASGELGRTAVVIASSRLRVGEFDALAALLRRAFAGGKSPSEVLAAMEAVLGRRGSLRSLERRLFP